MDLTPKWSQVFFVIYRRSNITQTKLFHVEVSDLKTKHVPPIQKLSSSSILSFPNEPGIACNFSENENPVGMLRTVMRAMLCTT